MSIPIMVKKERIRKDMLRKRNRFPELNNKRYDNWICGFLWEKFVNTEVKTVHSYIPMGSESDINPLIKRCLKNGIVVVVPKTVPNRRFKNLVLRSFQELNNGVFGTKYPAGGICWSKTMI